MPASLIWILALVTTGLGAGVFLAYAVAVLPGLARTDDRTFVASFAALDRAIARPPFLVGVFLGSPVLLLLTCLAGAAEHPPLAWGALTLGVVVVVITLAVHVPLNDALKAAGDDEDASVVRAAFQERRWAATNAVRTVAATGALVLLAVAGRA